MKFDSFFKINLRIGVLNILVEISSWVPLDYTWSVLKAQQDLRFELQTPWGLKILHLLTELYIYIKALFLSIGWRFYWFHAITYVGCLIPLLIHQLLHQWRTWVGINLSLPGHEQPSSSRKTTFMCPIRVPTGLSSFPAKIYFRSFVLCILGHTPQARQPHGLHLPISLPSLLSLYVSISSLSLSTPCRDEHHHSWLLKCKLNDRRSFYIHDEM